MAKTNGKHRHYHAPEGGLRIEGKTYRGGQRIPARYGRQLVNGQKVKDPSDKNDDVPAGFGRDVFPHIFSFQGMISTVSHVYRNPDEAVKHSLENARFMRNDCAIMECLEARQRMTALLNWHIEGDDKDDPRQKQLVEDMTAILKRIPRFTEYRRNLLEALWYGRYAVQHKFGFAKIRGKRRTVVKKWTPINGDKLVFRFDDGRAKYDDNEVGVKVSTVWSKRDAILGDRKIEITEYGPCYFLETWERPRVAVHKHIIEDGSYEDPISSGRIHGVGIRDRIYWSWFQKQETMAHLMEIIERTGAGFTIYYYPSGDYKAKQEMEDVAAKQTHSNVILMPRSPGDPTMDAYGIDRIEPSTAGVQALKEIVHDFFATMIKRYILGQTLSSEPAGGGIGDGTASLHLETLLQIIQYDAVNLEETITVETLEPLKNYNFPWARDIALRFVIDTESADSEKKIGAHRAVWDMGLKLKASDLYDLIGASMPTDEDEVLQNPAVAQQARLWEQSHQQPGGDPENPEDPGMMDGGPEGPDDDGGGGQDLDGMFGPLMQMVGPQFAGAAKYAKQWTESKHPRDSDGKFVGDGGWLDKVSEAFKFVPTGYRDQRRILKDLSDDEIASAGEHARNYLAEHHPDVDVSQEELDFLKEMESDSPAKSRPVAHEAFILIEKLREAEISAIYIDKNEADKSGHKNKDYNQQSRHVRDILTGKYQYARRKAPKSSPGQMDLFGGKPTGKTVKWKEELHPRDDTGKFAEKEGGGAEGGEMPLFEGKEEPEEDEGQKRAAAGGEIGPNGEWYPGGAYIATTDMPKKVRDKRDRAAAGSVYTEPGVREVPEPGKLSIFAAVGDYFDYRTGSINEQAVAYYNQDFATISELVGKYQDGDRWVDVDDYPLQATFADMARMAKAGVPIPGESLEQMASFRGVGRDELESQLGVKKWDADPAAPEKTPDESLASAEAYAIGDETHFKGDKVTITSEPYELYGGMWQDAETEDGKKVTLPTPGERSKQVKDNHDAWQQQQGEFRGLREAGDSTGDDPGETEAEEQAGPVAFNPDEHGGYKPLLEVVDRIADGEIKADEFRQEFERYAGAKDAYVEDMQKRFDAKQLRNIAANLGSWDAKRNTKQKNAEEIYNKLMMHAFHTGEGGFSYTMGMGDSAHDSMIAALRKHVEGQTDETLAAESERLQASHEARKEQAESKSKAVSNPETLDEFRQYEQHHSRKGEVADPYWSLSPEKRREWDKLEVEERRKEREADREKAATVERLKGDAPSGFDITKNFHSKRGIDIFTASPKERVDRDGFMEMKAKAAKLGGWYYKAFKGTPGGFHFDNEDSAKKFASLISGDVDNSDKAAEQEQSRNQTVSQRLAGLADSMQTSAEEALAAPRQENTARRADMAASARGTANANISKAKTMRQIAAAIEEGKADLLQGVSAKTHVDELDRLLKKSKWDYYRRASKGPGGKELKDLPDELRYHNFEGREPDEQTIDAAEYPYPGIHRNFIADIKAALRGKRGIKHDVAVLEAAANRAESEYVKFSSPGEWSALKAVVSKLKQYSGREHKRLTQHLEDNSDSFRRLQFMGIKNGHELREALRQYHSLKAPTAGEDPVKKAERSLVGRKLPGFFPTPPSVSEQMLAAADIQPGHEVLEPSAGKGDLLDAIKLHQPESKVSAIEFNRELKSVLDAKGHDAEFGDFLDHRGQYDRIVMNPPFENAADQKHVRHAFENLKPGGRLVAVMSAGGRGREEFDNWLSENGGYSEDLPSNSFAGADSFRKTGVNTRMVVIDKPGGSDKYQRRYSRPQNEVARADTLLRQRLFPVISSGRSATLGMVKDFWPRNEQLSARVANAQVMFDSSLPRPFAVDGWVVRLGIPIKSYIARPRYLGTLLMNAIEKLQGSFGHVTRYKADFAPPSIKPPAGPSPAATSPSRVGETKSVGGVMYRLNENHRWELADKEQPTGDKPAKTAEKPHPLMTGLISALRESPEFKAGQDVVTQSIAPEQAEKAYQWMHENAGKQAGGGQVVDFGDGKIGYASARGSMIMDYSGGKFTAHYTDKTELAGEVVEDDPVETETSRNLEVEDRAETHTPDESGSQVIPIKDEPAAPEPDSDRTETSQEPPVAPKPTRAATARKKADDARDKLEAAVDQWGIESEKGLNRHGQAAWRSYTASLRAQWRQLDQLAKHAEREEKPKPERKPRSPRQEGGKDKPTPLMDSPGGGEVPGSSKPVSYWQLTNSGRKAFDRVESELADHELDASEQNVSALRDAISRGQIQGTSDLRGVLATASRLRQSVNQTESDHGQIKEAIRRKASREPKQSWQSIVKEHAAAWDMTPEDFEAVADEVWREKSRHLEAVAQASQAARMLTGLTAKDINDLENKGFDSGSSHEKTRGLDDIGRSMASQFPELGWGAGYESGDLDDTTDYGEHLWQLLRMGEQRPPSKNSPEFLSEVEDYLEQQASGHKELTEEEREELAAVPFSRREGKVRYTSPRQ